MIYNPRDQADFDTAQMQIRYTIQNAIINLNLEVFALGVLQSLTKKNQIRTNLCYQNSSSNYSLLICTILLVAMQSFWSDVTDITSIGVMMLILSYI